MGKAKEVYEAITTKSTLKDVLDGLKDGCDIGTTCGFGTFSRET